MRAASCHRLAGHRLAGHLALLLAAAALAACDGAPTAPAGLERTQQRLIPNDSEGTPHGAQLFADQAAGRLFVADTFGGVVAYDGDSPLPAFHSFLPDAGVSCTTLARHEASHTLYCAALDTAAIARFDDTTGTIRAGNDGFLQAFGYRSLLVVDDTLYAAKVPAGIDRFAIAADGSLSAPDSLQDGAFQQLAYDGTTLYAAGTDRGLVAIAADGIVTDIAALDGPVIRLRAHAGRAAIALGSQGVAVIDLASGSLVSQLHPPCAVISADVAGDILAVGCYSGVYAYDLATERVFGWARAQIGIMDVVLSGTSLNALDWWHLDSYVIDPNGSARAVDAPPGYLVQPGRGLSLTVRNPGDLPLHLDGQEIPAYGSIELAVEASDETSELDLVADEGTAADTTTVVIARDAHLPGIGAPFPIPGMTRRLAYFSSGTCALQWPELDDLAWLTARGKPPGGWAPIVIAPDASDSADTVDPWVQSSMPVVWSPLEVASLGALLPGKSGDETYFQDLDPGRLIPGGDDEAQFWVDENGIVQWFERAYEGSYEAP